MCGKIEEYKEMVRNRHPFLTDVWCTMDGLKITLEQSGDALIQEHFYNGWKHDHYVFLFYVSAQTEPSLLPTLTSQALFMTVRLPTMGIYMTSLRWCINEMAGNVPLTQLLVT